MALLHGGPGSWDDFDGLASLIDDLVEVHRYDQRGSLRSEDAGPYDIDTFVADLDALRAHWGHDRWIVAGHSWGAGLALAYAVAHPERVAAVVYLSGTGIALDWPEEYHANADARRTPAQRARYEELRAIVKDAPERAPPELMREYCALAWAPDFADAERAVELAEAQYRAPGPNYAVNAALNAHWRFLLEDGSFAARVSALDVPVLLVHGAADPRPPRLAQRLAASLRDARLTVIEGAGHLPWVERPGEVREALRPFLREMAARMAPAEASP